MYFDDDIDRNSTDVSVVFVERIIKTHLKIMWATGVLDPGSFKLCLVLVYGMLKFVVRYSNVSRGAPQHCLLIDPKPTYNRFWN